MDSAIVSLVTCLNFDFDRTCKRSTSNEMPVVAVEDDEVVLLIVAADADFAMMRRIHAPRFCLWDMISYTSFSSSSRYIRPVFVSEWNILE